VYLTALLAVYQFMKRQAAPPAESLIFLLHSQAKESQAHSGGASAKGETNWKGRGRFPYP